MDWLARSTWHHYCLYTLRGLLPRKCKHLSKRLHQNTWMDSSSRHLEVVCIHLPIWQYQALMHYAHNALQLYNCVAVRISRGMRTLPFCSVFVTSIVFWWTPEHPHSYSTAECDPACTVDLRELIGQATAEACVIQYLIAEDSLSCRACVGRWSHGIDRHEYIWLRKD